MTSWKVFFVHKPKGSKESLSDYRLSFKIEYFTTTWLITAALNEGIILCNIFLYCYKLNLLIYWSCQRFLRSFDGVDAAIQSFHTLEHGTKLPTANLFQLEELWGVPGHHVAFHHGDPLRAEEEFHYKFTLLLIHYFQPVGKTNNINNQCDKSCIMLCLMKKNILILFPPTCYYCKSHEHLITLDGGKTSSSPSPSLASMSSPQELKD